jgi:hypothetical protein
MQKREIVSLKQPNEMQGFIRVVFLCIWILAGFSSALAGNIYPGNFTLASSPGVRSNPRAITPADINGDGLPDLICVYYNSFIATELTNNGSGFGLYAAPSDAAAHSAIIMVSNIDDHGLVGFVVANFVGASISVLTNSSGGLAVASSAPAGTYPSSIAAADVNGDGSIDLIVANDGNNTLSVLTNNGSGMFALSSSPPTGFSPASVTAADVNGDGKIDLISANEGTNTLTILTNNGSGSFATASSPAVGNGPYCVIAVTNLDGHGLMALVSANYSDGTLTVLTNNGSGIFGLNATYTVGGGPECVIAADVNGDGYPDLISANTISNSLTVYTNNGSGGFVLDAILGAGSQPCTVIAADVNGDGHPDLICANFGGSTLSVFTNSPSYPPPINGFSPSSGSPGTLVTINGTNFNSVIGVTFNGMPASFTINSNSQITATVPDCASTGPITVANATGTTSSSSNFTFVKLPEMVAAPDESQLDYALCNDSTITFGFSGTLGITSTKVISSSIILDGTGQNVAISGSNNVNIFTVQPGGQLTLKNLTLINGHATGGGGGIYNDGGTVVLINCTFSNDVAVGAAASGPGGNGGEASGGAILNDGTIIVSDSTFVNNDAVGGFGAANATGTGGAGGNGGMGMGGGIYNDDGGSLAITNCTFYNNLAVGGNAGQGGSGNNGSTFTYQCGTVCCAHDAFGDCTEDCPVYCTGTNYGTPGGNGGNGGSAYGGNIYNNNGNVIIVNTTFDSGSLLGGAAGSAGPNGAYSSGSGIAGIPGGGGGGNLGQGTGSFIFLNCIVANPIDGGNFFGGTIVDAGNNLSSDTTLAFTNATSLTNASPNLGTLTNNGGFTWTMALLPASPAVRAGTTNGAPLTDQRGQLRKSLQIDLGAYETPVTPSGIPSVLDITNGLMGGKFGLTFTNTPGTSFSVWSSANLSLPFTDWTFLGFAREIAPGQFQFNGAGSTNDPHEFYRITSP